jgi:hypothetical protein
MDMAVTHYGITKFLNPGSTEGGILGKRWMSLGKGKKENPAPWKVQRITEAFIPLLTNA